MAVGFHSTSARSGAYPVLGWSSRVNMCYFSYRQSLPSKKVSILQFLSQFHPLLSSILNHFSSKAGLLVNET